MFAPELSQPQNTNRQMYLVQQFDRKDLFISAKSIPSKKSKYRLIAKNNDCQTQQFSSRDQSYRE